MFQAAQLFLIFKGVDLDFLAFQFIFSLGGIASPEKDRELW